MKKISGGILDKNVNITQTYDMVELVKCEMII